METLFELDARRIAAEVVRDRFLGQPFQWGHFDCVRLAAASAKALGHKVSLIKAGAYSTEMGAVRALKRAGFDKLTDALDARFDRIAPAAALMGDIVGLETEADWPALNVAVGNGLVLGFLNGACHVLRPLVFREAWRVTCLTKVDG